jgi:imidazolonepropionase
VQERKSMSDTIPMKARVVTCPAVVTASGAAPRRGISMADLDVTTDAALAWDENGLLTYVGPAAGLGDEADTHADGAVIPGFVDCHTHLPFFGWRADEFHARVGGRTYRDVNGGGGGIARSARLLGQASDEDVLAFCRPLVDEMLAHGTTAFELKTGYGLSVEAELRQARLARLLANEIPQTTTITLLACHAIPADRNRREWVEQVCTELIPAASGEGLIDAVDVYVEDFAFTVDDFRRVADMARELGLAVRCHADQLGPSGAAEAAVAFGARNADHLNHASDVGMAELGGSDTASVLLPVADLVTREQLPPVAGLIEAGAALAVASDFNPGTSPCLSMPEVISVGVSLYRLQPAIALTGATLNAAWALHMDGRLGSLEPGKRADFLVLDSPDVAMLPYRPGHNPVAQTWIGGRRVIG